MINRRDSSFRRVAILWVYGVNSVSENPRFASAVDVVKRRSMNYSRTASATDTVNAGSPATRDVIAQRAHQIWEKLGCPADRDVEIWLQAERELKTPGSTPAPEQARLAQNAPAAPLTPPTADNAAHFVSRPLPPTSAASAKPRKENRGSKATPR